MATTQTVCALREDDLATEKGLSAKAVHERLVTLTTADRRLESALCFYLLEVETRALFTMFGHASTVDYARECLGLEDRKTRTLLRLAARFQELPKMRKAFGRGEIPYTKAREAVKVATPETEEAWIEKCAVLTNRQLEREVNQELPPKRTRFLSFVLDESRIIAWERVCEAMERMAGKTLTDIEVFDLACACAMLEHDLTPPLGHETDAITGYVAKVIERDNFQCTRPGCSSRSALQGSHIKPRSHGGSDDPSNIHTACAVCHHAIELGILKIRGTAPDNITWEGPFGLIESPLPKDEAMTHAAREPGPEYGSPPPMSDVSRETKTLRPASAKTRSTGRRRTQDAGISRPTWDKNWEFGDRSSVRVKGWEVRLPPNACARRSPKSENCHDSSARNHVHDAVVAAILEA